MLFHLAFRATQSVWEVIDLPSLRHVVGYIGFVSCIPFLILLLFFLFNFFLLNLRFNHSISIAY